MLLIRRFEERCAEMYALGKIGGFCHLYIGEEAVAVGAIDALRDDDYVFSAYRDHGHCLARGSDPKAVMAELFGRSTGLCKGKGGSMHLIDVARRFMGGYAIVGAHLPLAAGAAFGVKYRGGDQIVLCFFGALTQLHECPHRGSRGRELSSHIVGDGARRRELFCATVGEREAHHRHLSILTWNLV